MLFIHRRLTAPLQEPRMELSPLLAAVVEGDTTEVFQLLDADPRGLTEQEAARRLALAGGSAIASVQAPAWWVQLARAFATPFLAVLLVLTLVSLITDILLVTPAERQWTKVVLLTTMMGISGLLRFWQEFRSQRAIARLNAQLPLTATVSRRPGTAAFSEEVRRTIPVAELVRGDLLHVSAGQMLPADVRFLHCHHLFVSQSSFTGESLPVEKYGILYGQAETSARRTPAPLDVATLGLMGTTVVSGTATAIVVTTGAQTFFGAVASSVRKRRAMTSFDLGVQRVSQVLMYLMLVMVPIVFVLNGLLKGDWREALLFALAVAVGLTPEMLPLVVTASLAKGALAMAREQVIVKHGPAMQNLGAMDVLCTDKTGTLTLDQITLVRHLDVRGNESDAVLHLAYLNSGYQTGVQNLVDQAILEHWHQAHANPTLSHCVKLYELPFDVFRRRMSVIVQPEGELPLLVCKGAFEELLAICSWVEEQGERYPLDEVRRARIERLAASLSQEGLRVIAVASKRLSWLEERYSLSDEQDLVLQGFVALLDPPKPSARAALHALHELGIVVKILTGDNERVATRICEELGLDASHLLLGRELEGLDEEELATLTEQTTLFARLTPLHKARVIRALKRKGHTVGYLGDGLNDVAALWEADVSLSVDTAVDAAKAAADLILLQKNLLVLAQGVREGRRVFGNIIKYLKITLSANFSNALSILGASVLLPFLPMLSLQLLVQNLLYDCSQLALPWDRVDPESVTRPRPWDMQGLTRFLFLFGPLSSLFDCTTFFLLWFVFQANTPQVQALFQSGWFLEGVLSQLLMVQVLRTQGSPFSQRRATWPVLLLSTGMASMCLLLPLTPFGTTFLGLRPLPLSYFPWLLATLLGYGGLAHVLKRWYLKRFGSWL